MATAAANWLTDHDIKLPAAAAKQFSRAWLDVTARYPDDVHTRDVVLLAAAQYLAGGLSLPALGRRLAKARSKADEAMAVVRAVSVLAVVTGVPEVQTARDVGVDRMALRRWLGKR